MTSFEINSIGTVRNDRTDVQRTDHWGAVRSTITIDERFGDACLQGLEGFSPVSGTPVIDLKPAMREFLPADIHQPDWVSRLMSEYFLP